MKMLLGYSKLPSAAGATAKLPLLSRQGKHLFAQPSAWEHHNPAVSAVAIDSAFQLESIMPVSAEATIYKPTSAPLQYASRSSQPVLDVSVWH